MMGKFENKVVIVTGASSGIGAATAITFAKEGAKLVICGRSEERLEETTKACKSAGAKVLKVIGDVGKFENLESIITKTVNEYSSIDILINNAGQGYHGNIADMELDKYEDLFRTNLRAPVFLCKFVMPHLIKTKGCIVNISSVAGLKSSPPFIPYAMTKCALDHFTRGFSAECAPFGVRVNGINPAAVKTRFGVNAGATKEAYDQFLESAKRRHPLGIMEPETIAESILFLCSAPHVTGGASGGIGAATALAFAKEGANLVICGRNEGRLEETNKACKSAGAKVLKVIGDVGKFENLEPIITKTVEEYSSIDILINNAGYGYMGSIADLELDTYEDLFRINLRAPVFLCKFVMPHLIKTKGCIVNVSSLVGLKSSPPFIPYALTKCALDHFTRGFSAECAPFGVRVNSINPAGVKTGFMENSGVRKETINQFRESAKRRHHFGIIKPETIAESILFLCSAPHVTGVSLPVDSGVLNYSAYTN